MHNECAIVLEPDNKNVRGGVNKTWDLYAIVAGGEITIVNIWHIICLILIDLERNSKELKRVEQNIGEQGGCFTEWMRVGAIRLSGIPPNEKKGVSEWATLQKTVKA